MEGLCLYDPACMVKFFQQKGSRKKWRLDSWWGCRVLFGYFVPNRVNHMFFMIGMTCWVFLNQKVEETIRLFRS